MFAVRLVLCRIQSQSGYPYFGRQGRVLLLWRSTNTHTSRMAEKCQGALCTTRGERLLCLRDKKAGTGDRASAVSAGQEGWYWRQRAFPVPAQVEPSNPARAVLPAATYTSNDALAGCRRVLLRCYAAQTGCSKTSVLNYRSALRNVAEEPRS
jgi:hypothetical protein